MFSLKNLIYQLLILAVFAALTNCSPVSQFSDKALLHSSEVTTEDNITTTTSPSSGPGNINILDEAQFKASGLSLLQSDPSPDFATGRVVCETSDGSPNIINSINLTLWFRRWDDWFCCNWNTNGGGCSHILTIGDASTALCGGQGCIKCGEMQSNLWEILRLCRRENKVGGVSYLAQGIHVVLY